MAIKLGNVDIPFVYQGEELLYPAPIKDGLVLWYDFSGMTNEDKTRDTAVDLSGNGNHGTLQNFNYTPESGYDKNKLLFDGVDDAIVTPPNIMEGTNSYTVSITINIKELANNLHGYFMLGTGIGRVWIRSVGNQLSANTYFGKAEYDFTSVITNNTLDLGVAHITLVIDRQGAQSVYLNGEVKSQRDIYEASDVPTHFGDIILGMRSSYSSPVADYFSTKVYNRVLTPSEIAHNYAIEKERFGIE